MSIPLDVYDPELDGIVRVLKEANDQFKFINSNVSSATGDPVTRSVTRDIPSVPTNHVTGNEIPRNTISKTVQLPQALTLSENRILMTKNLTKELEKYFEKAQKNQKVLNEDQLFRMQNTIFEQLKRSQQINTNSIQQQNKEKEQSYLKKLFSATLFDVAKRYILLKSMKKNALKRLKQLRLQAAYKKWRRRQIAKLEQKEFAAQLEEEREKIDPYQERLAQLKATKAEMDLFFGINDRSQEKMLLDEFAPGEIEEVIEKVETMGDNAHDLICDLQDELGISKHLSEAEQSAFKAEIDNFKQTLFEIGTTIAKTPEHLKELTNRFENEVLGKLDTWKEKTKQLMHHHKHNAQEKLDQCFDKISSGLSNLLKGEPLQKVRSAVQNDELCANAKASASASDGASGLRKEALEAAKLAKLAETQTSKPARSHLPLFKARFPEKTEKSSTTDAPEAKDSKHSSNSPKTRFEPPKPR